MVNALIALLLNILTIPLAGVVLRDLWNWFLTTVGMPQVSIVQALGLGLTLKVFSSFVTPHEGDVSQFERWVTSVLYLLIVWGVGAIYHSLL